MRTTLFTTLLTGVLLSTAAHSQDADEEILVIGITPAQTTGLPEAKIPYNVQSATSEELERAHSLSISDFLNQNFGSISINDAQNNPLQADVQYRGYTVSPLLGLAQGLAVYQNGVRINEPLGDAVNWDLLPESAIHSINLIGGANPLFGLNTLGGALAIRMKDGFNSEGHHADVYGGSFDRVVGSIESGGNNGVWGYYGHVNYFDEKGWRDLSASDAINFYGSIGMRTGLSTLNLNMQHGDSELTGNGAIPVELLELDRSAIFTAPDVTENNLFMLSVDGAHQLTDNIQVSINGFYRSNDTDSFNGDATEFEECLITDVNNTEAVLIEVNEDALDNTALDCETGFTENELKKDLNGEVVEDLDGNPVLAEFDDDERNALNNISNRKQKSYGTDMNLTFLHDLFGNNNQLVMGFAYFRGDSTFISNTEVTTLDPITRTTANSPDRGVFVEEAATHIDTETQSMSVYFTNTLDLTEQLSLTLSGRLNNTIVELADQSGKRPELNGEHDFLRFNPALGVTWQATENINIYGSYSQSSRAPTPIELACNDRVAAIAQAAGDDFEECRLPNAFLADPPLEDVVSKSIEAGIRGAINNINYHLGFFRTRNKDDIIFQSTGRATGLFANVDETRRLGIETSLDGQWGKLGWGLAYSYIEASFEDNLRVLNPNHPDADDEDEIEVTSGDRIPGVPENQLKLRADYALTEGLSVGIEALHHSAQVLRADESNQLPKVGGYTVVNLRGRYRFNEHVELYAKINNLFDNDYETFGLIGEEPDELDVPVINDFDNPRFLGPAAPISVFVGVKASL